MPAEIKPIAGMERIKLCDAVPLPAPFTLFVFPTTYCNFKCNYCAHSLGYTGMKEKYGFEPEHMPLDTVKHIVEQVKAFPQKLKMLSLTGQGEPLLNKELPIMVELIKKADVAERIEIITNASMLTHEMSDALISGGLDTLRISLQGLSAEKYKKICGVNINMDEFISNINYFYQQKGKCKLYIKIMDVALDENEDMKFYETFSNLCDRMYIEQRRPVYAGVKLTDGMKVTADRYGRQHENRQVCPLCFFMLGIFPNGDVEPCDSIYKPVTLGNVKNISLFEMWQGEILRNFQKMQLQMKRYDNPKCAVCCAPDDVAHPEDELDTSADDVLHRYEAKE